MIAPLGVTQFENPKVLVSEAVIIVLFLYHWFKKSITLPKSLLLPYVLIFLLTLTQLIIFLSSLSLLGNSVRLQGIFLLWLLMIFSAITSARPLPHVPAWVYPALLLIALAATLILPVNAAGRFVGTLGEPNASAAFLLFLWPLVRPVKSHIWSWIPVSITFLALVFLYQSRSALIGLALQLTFLGLKRLRLSTAKSVIVCGLLLVSSLALPFFAPASLFENRAAVWQAAFAAGLGHPWLGGGFGRTELLLHTAAASLHFPLQYAYVDSSHNIFLDWWVQGGLAGILLLFFLIFRSAKKFVRADARTHLILLLGLVAALSFNPASVVGLLEFWWLLGQSPRNII